MKPYIEKGNLVIPFTCDRKYHYWAGGQSILKTLKEIGAPTSVIKKYEHLGGMRK